MQVRTIHEQRIKQLLAVVWAGRNANGLTFEFDLGLAALQYLKRIDAQDMVVETLSKVVSEPAYGYRYRAEAISMLASMKDANAVVALLEAFQDQYLRRDARVALAAVKHESSVPPLVRYLQPPHDDLMRLDAAETLEGIGSPLAVEGLIVALSDRSSYVRLAAVSALAKCGDKEAVPYLIRALEDDVAEVRVEAILWLERLDASESLVALQKVAANDIATVGGEDWTPIKRVSDIAQTAIIHIQQKHAQSS